MRTLTLLATAVLAPLTTAQNVSHPPPATPANHLSQFVTGLDIAANIGSYSGLTAAGETVISMSTTACNPGSVDGVWEANPDPDHPLICQSYFRLHNNRFEQISDYSYGKHSFSSTNSGGCGGGCAGGFPFNRLKPNCSDTYGSTLNWSRGDLGPLTEWNAWTGEYDFFGSHIDTGFPQTTPNGSASSINPNHNRQFRCRIPNGKIGTAGATYFSFCFYLHNWEPEANRENNMASRQINLSVGSATNAAAQQTGNILEDRYTGARVESAFNDVGGVAMDGRFYVGVHVADNGNGTWRYEYAVHNRDNHAGNVQFRVPVCEGATVTSIGAKDVDLNGFNPANNWTGAHVGDEVVFDPGPGARPQGWHTVYNFWFNCDAPPGDGTVEIMGDPSRLNPGANVSVIVASDVPSAPLNVDLGEGCGLTMALPSSATTPSTLNLGVTGGDANAAAALHVAFTDDSFALFPPFGPTTCTLLTPAFTIPFTLDPSGNGTGVLSVPDDAGFDGLQFFIQSAALSVGGPVLGLAELSNRIRVPICP